jgi:hypothetical protein
MVCGALIGHADLREIDHEVALDGSSVLNETVLSGLAVGLQEEVLRHNTILNRRQQETAVYQHPTVALAPHEQS